MRLAGGHGFRASYTSDKELRKRIYSHDVSVWYQLGTVRLSLPLQGIAIATYVNDVLAHFVHCKMITVILRTVGYWAYGRDRKHVT